MLGDMRRFREAASLPPLPRSLMGFIRMPLRYMGGDMERYPGPTQRFAVYIRPPLPATTRKGNVQTAARRRQVLEEFKCFVRARYGVGLGPYLEHLPTINVTLDQFRRHLYYAHTRHVDGLSGTINAVAGLNLPLERNLPTPWNLVRKWRGLEPNIPHLALPVQILLAFLTLCALWGWPRYLGTLRGGSLGALRPIEGYDAPFSAYSLPQDRLGDGDVVFRKIADPTTKRIAARRQHTRFADSKFARSTSAFKEGQDPSSKVFGGGPSGDATEVPSGEPRGRTLIQHMPAPEVQEGDVDMCTAMVALAGEEQGFVPASVRVGGCTCFHEHVAHRDLPATLWHMRSSNA